MKWKKRNGLPLMQQVDRTCTIKRSCQATSPFVIPLQFLQGNSSRDTKAVGHSRLLHSNCSLLPPQQMLAPEKPASSDMD
jgi:hypothetical protein